MKLVVACTLAGAVSSLHSFDSIKNEVAAKIHRHTNDLIRQYTKSKAKEKITHVPQNQPPRASKEQTGRPPRELRHHQLTTYSYSYSYNWTGYEDVGFCNSVLDEYAGWFSSPDECFHECLQTYNETTSIECRAQPRPPPSLLLFLPFPRGPWTVTVFVSRSPPHWLLSAVTYSRAVWVCVCVCVCPTLWLLFRRL